MSTKRRTVQSEDIIAINEAYLKIGTYAGAGRATGWSGSTVKRYIIDGYVAEKDKTPMEKIEFTIPNIEELFYPTSWSNFLTLTDEEVEDIKELQKTISI